MSGYRPEYTHDEEKRIVDYIVENQLFHLIKGDRLWRDMEEEAVVDRTWQSLKQHFRKRIIFDLHYPRYGLDETAVANFREAFNKVPEPKKTKTRAKPAQPPAQRQVKTRREANLELDSDSDSSD